MNPQNNRVPQDARELNEYLRHRMNKGSGFGTGYKDRRKATDEMI